MVFVIVQENYTANGWLGFMMAGAFYYVMHRDDAMQKNFPKLITYLDGKNDEKEETIKAREAKVSTVQPSISRDERKK